MLYVSVIKREFRIHKNELIYYLKKALKVLNPRGSYPYISHCFTHVILDFITVKYNHQVKLQ